MITIQKGSWRGEKDGKYKPFVRGCEQLEGTIVEVVSREGKSTFIKLQELTTKSTVAMLCISNYF